MKCTLLCTELVGRNVLANIMTVWPAFQSVGMKANGYNALQEADANCAGSRTQSVHAIAIALQAQSQYCYNALRRHCNASLLAYPQHAATA
jgi:hypothetical protein